MAEKRRQKSGAQKRREKREREEAAELAARPPGAPSSPPPSDTGASDIDAQAQAKRFRDIGPPPPDAAQRIEWGNRISAEIAYEQLVAPHVRTSGERRLVLEAVRTLGMTGVKSLYESKLRKLENKVYGARGKVADAHSELEESD